MGCSEGPEPTVGLPLASLSLLHRPVSLPSALHVAVPGAQRNTVWKLRFRASSQDHRSEIILKDHASGNESLYTMISSSANPQPPSKPTSRVLLLGRGVGRAPEGSLGQAPNGAHCKSLKLTAKERGLMLQAALRTL